jgi:hypothetical protein
MEGASMSVYILQDIVSLYSFTKDFKAFMAISISCIVLKQDKENLTVP